LAWCQFEARGRYREKIFSFTTFTYNNTGQIGGIRASLLKPLCIFLLNHLIKVLLYGITAFFNFAKKYCKENIKKAMLASEA